MLVGGHRYFGVYWSFLLLIFHIPERRYQILQLAQVTKSCHSRDFYIMSTTHVMIHGSVLQYCVLTIMPGPLIILFMYHNILFKE